MLMYNKQITLPEVFDKVKEKETVSERVAVLKKYETKQMRWFVGAFFSGDFRGMEVPEYTPNPGERGVAFSSISRSIKRLESCLIHKDKKKVVEMNMRVVLESVTKREAELIVSMLNGERMIDGIDKKVFKKAYPEFFRSKGSLI